jgi:hypothetical protein
MSALRSHNLCWKLIDGFQAAYKRLTPIAWQGDQDEAFIALFEVVAWSGAIRDWSKARGTKGIPGIDGLYFVRNRVLHYGADALSQVTVFVSGAYGSGPYGMGPFGGSGGYTTPTWTWRPSRRLPRGWSKTGKSEYDSLLAGRPIATTLEAVSIELARRRR